MIDGIFFDSIYTYHTLLNYFSIFWRFCLFLLPIFHLNKLSQNITHQKSHLFLPLFINWAKGDDDDEEGSTSCAKREREEELCDGGDVRAEDGLIYSYFILKFISITADAFTYI